MTGEARRRRAQRHIGRLGQTVKIHPSGAAQGLERRFSGEEEGFVAVKGLFTEAPLSLLDAGAVERLRGEADESRGAHRERRLTVAALDLAFEPTHDARVVAAGKTYAVADVDPIHFGEVTLAYGLALRPV